MKSVTKARLLTVLILITLVVTAGLLCGCNFDLFATKINLSFNSEIVMSDNFYLYTAQEIKPQVTVMHRDEVVAEQKYTLTYSDNIQPGVATVIAEGVDDYFGSVEATFTIGYEYTFNVQGAESVDGETLQQVTSKDDLQPPTVDKLGYTFSHWSYNSQAVDFDDLDWLPASAEFVANYTLNVYSIEYVLDGEVYNPADNKTTYTVEDAFDLANASLEDMRFAGWYTDEEHENRITSLSGYAQNLVLYAKFVDLTEMMITYVTPQEAQAVPFELLMPGTALTAPLEQTTVIDGMDKRLVWYADSDYLVKYVFRIMPDEDVTVYARWEDAISAGFLNKIDRFSAANVTLNSYQDLVDYIDYVCFMNIVAPTKIVKDEDGSDKVVAIFDDFNWVKVTYSSSADLKSRIEQALNIDCAYPRMATATYTIQESEQSFKLALRSDVTVDEATRYTTELADILPQMWNIFALQSSGRSSDYDKFPIDFVEKTYAVSTSNQLFYVMAHGYRPLPVAGSKAEAVYNAFREIMRNICDDSMSDLEKVRAIYEYLILYVQYDYAAAETLEESETYLYDAFYLEGVLRGVAVCDGISKAFSVMCAIEGIDCVRVTGESIYDGVGHAWNKVQILGSWYVTDATWGNVEYNDRSSEIMSYQYMLFTDKDRQSFESQNYTQYKALTAFDLGEYYSTRTMKVGNYVADLYIDSAEELSYVLEFIALYYKNNLSAISGMSFEIILNPKLVEELQRKSANVSNQLYNETYSIYSSRNRTELSIERSITYGADTYNLIYIFS